MKSGSLPSSVFLLLVAMVAGTHAATATMSDEILVGAFSSGIAGDPLPEGWRIAKLPGVSATRFELVENGGDVVVQMDAADAAATLYRPVRLDPAKSPILRWRWRIRNLIAGADLTRKRGDDVPVRLYVMFDYPLERLSLIERGKILLARTVAGDLVPAAALCYVWDGTLPVNTRLWNAYSDRVRIIVLQSGSGRLGKWVLQERDVASDFLEAFGENAPPISGIAIAADTDQTGETVRSWFGDIGFSPREQNGDP